MTTHTNNMSPVYTTLSPSNHSEGDSYDDDLWAWRIGLYAIGGSVVASLGIVGNSMTVIVLAHFRKKASIPLLLICLAVQDTIYLVAEAMLENVSFLSMAGLVSDDYRTFIRPVYGNLYPVPEVTKMSVSYTVIIITTERYMAVVWPFAIRLMGRHLVAGLSVLAVVGVSILYHIPMYLAHDYEYVWDPLEQTWAFRFFRTEFGECYFYNHIYHTWINLMIKFAIPFIVLLVLNTHMIIVLNNSNAIKTSKKRESQDHRLSVMVASMIFIFFICSLFPAVSHILTTGINGYTECSAFCNRFSAVADVMRMVNSAINFVIYCATGRNFRTIFKELFCRVTTSRRCRTRKGQQRCNSGNTDTRKNSGKSTVSTIYLTRFNNPSS